MRARWLLRSALSLIEHVFVPPQPASILHADLDSFFASVEQRDDRRLRGRPVAVGGGVILAASYEAKAFGVKGAMGIVEARRRCPGLRVVPPRMEQYSAASKAVFEVFRATTPFVEGISIDEAFLDVSGLWRISGTPVEIARQLRVDVRERVGLPITVGVASTKFLAKVASAVGKPDGLLEVPAGGELEFLHPLPVERLWGVGPKTAERLHARGLKTVGDMAKLSEEALAAIVGRASGHHLHSLAHNRDPRRVQPRRRRRSMGAQRALGRRVRSAADIDATLVALVDRVARRMRGAGRVGRTLVLRLRFDDYTRATRSRTLRAPTAQTDTLLAGFRRLLAASTPLIEAQGLTLIGISITNLDGDDAVQLELPFGGQPSHELDHVVDDVRERFGNDALVRGVLVGRSKGVVMPTLPDGP